MKVRGDDPKIITGRKLTLWGVQGPCETLARNTLTSFFSIIGTVFAVGLLLLPTNAEAARQKMRTLAYQGSWGAFSDSAGTVCLMVNEATDRLVISYQAGDDYVSVQVSSPRWDVDDGAQYTIAMVFSGESTSWTASGTGGHFNNDLPYVDVKLNEEIEKWMEKFVESDSLEVTFPDSKVSLSISLPGGRDVIKAFRKCVQEAQ